MMRKAVLVFTLLLSVAVALANPGESTEALDIGSRLELFVDDYLVDELVGTRLVLHHPRPAEVALRFDRPWEGAFCAYVTVLQDGEIYRMYYRGKPSANPDGSLDEVTCYAESRDGIHWEKPDLGLFEVAGTRKNNVVLGPEYAPVPHNFIAFVDTRPGIPSSQRYKGLGGLFPISEHKRFSNGLIGFTSPDGIRWKQIQQEPLIGPSLHGFTDTTPSPTFWSPHEGQYVCYVRAWRRDPGKPVHYEGWTGNVRWVGRTTSKDFLNWTPVQIMDVGDGPLEHIYTNQTSPYFRAPHIYLGVAARFLPGRQVVNAEQARQLKVDPKYFRDCSNAVLLTSRGGTRYQRAFLEAFIRPGIGLQNWTSRTNYPSLNLVSTGAEEISLYVQHEYGQPNHRLRRYILRTDGLVSVSAPYSGGEFLTRALRFSGSELVLNFSTSAPGSIRAEIQRPDGQPYTGYALADSDELIGNEIERVVTWRGNQDVGPLSGKPVRLRFVMKDADLYSLRFK